MLVSVQFLTRSKEDRKAADRFDATLVDRGYTKVHSGTYTRFVPSKERIGTERRRLTAVLPGNGRMLVLEVSSAAMARAVVVDGGEPVSAPVRPELLTVYCSSENPQVRDG